MMIELLDTLGLAYYQDWQLNGPNAAGTSPVAPPYERIQLGDIAQKGGGRMTRDASHQTGLDVDIVYMRRTTARRAPRAEPRRASTKFL